MTFFHRRHASWLRMAARALAITSLFLTGTRGLGRGWKDTRDFLEGTRELTPTGHWPLVYMGRGGGGKEEEEEEETDTDVGQVTLNPGLCSTASFSPRWEESQSRPALSTRPAEKA